MVNGFKDATLSEKTTFEQWVSYINALLSQSNNDNKKAF